MRFLIQRIRQLIDLDKLISLINFLRILIFSGLHHKTDGLNCDPSFFLQCSVWSLGHDLVMSPCIFGFVDFVSILCHLLLSIFVGCRKQWCERTSCEALGFITITLTHSLFSRVFVLVGFDGVGNLVVSRVLVFVSSRNIKCIRAWSLKNVGGSLFCYIVFSAGGIWEQ